MYKVIKFYSLPNEYIHGIIDFFIFKIKNEEAYSMINIIDTLYLTFKILNYGIIIQKTCNFVEYYTLWCANKDKILGLDIFIDNNYELMDIMISSTEYKGINEETIKEYNNTIDSIQNKIKKFISLL